MTAQTYDVVIVGARCAGATLATLLARVGALVLLLDKDRLASEQILSTHTIHPPGLDVLDEVGVGEAVRAVAPPMHIVRLRKNDAIVDYRFLGGRAEYCPRRKRLDGLLQDAAASAGVEVLGRTRVISLLRNGDRVVGVRVAGATGQEHEFRASLVVGADGRHSTVAQLVEAEEYLGYDAPRAMFWGYWNAPSFWRSDPAYRFGMYLANTGGHIRVIFQTDHDQLLIGSLPPVEEALSWRADVDAALVANLASDAITGPLVAGSAPEGGVRGTVKERYFFRRAVGNGWALVGDAGHHKEFVIGDGITEALLQARSLAAAIAQEATRCCIAGGGRGTLKLSRTSFWAERREGWALPWPFTKSSSLTRPRHRRFRRDWRRQWNINCHRRRRFLFTTCCGGCLAQRFGDRCRSYQSSSRWRSVPQRTAASYASVSSFSQRRRRSRHTPHPHRRLSRGADAGAVPAL